MLLLRRAVFTIDQLLPKAPAARPVNVDDLNLPTQGLGDDDMPPEASLLDLLSGVPDMEGIEFDIPTIEILFQPIDFD